MAVGIRFPKRAWERDLKGETSTNRQMKKYVMEMSNLRRLMKPLSSEESEIGQKPISNPKSEIAYWTAWPTRGLLGASLA